MAKPILLLGAGASIDAGLPSALDLTELIFHRLGQGGKSNANLFGYVIAKLQLRQARQGLSPFSKLNVELVYETLKRFLSRDSDVISEFVYSWDQIVDPLSERFDRRRFSEELSAGFEISERNGRISISSRPIKIQNAAAYISKAIDPMLGSADINNSMKPYLECLVNILNQDPIEIEYIEKLADFSAKKCQAVATLNYDTLFERSLKRRSHSYDYGLSRWNKSKYVRFTGQSLRLIKLHGSVDWFEDDDDIHYSSEVVSRARRGMIFGGQGEKLVPHGPYLQLRHEFQRLMRQTNVVGIIGYSFQDTHLNALIRAWISSRFNAKLVLLDPSTPRLGSSVLGVRRSPERVKIQHIRSTASTGMDEFIAALQKLD